MIFKSNLSAYLGKGKHAVFTFKTPPEARMPPQSCEAELFLSCYLLKVRGGERRAAVEEVNGFSFFFFFFFMPSGNCSPQFLGCLSQEETPGEWNPQFYLWGVQRKAPLPCPTHCCSRTMTDLIASLKGTSMRMWRETNISHPRFTQMRPFDL